MTVQKRTEKVVSEEIPPHLLEEFGQMMETPEEHDNGQQPETDVLGDYRIEILGKAAHLVASDRNLTYGPPEDSFAQIAALWSAYLHIDLLGTDVAAMMLLLKVARLSANPLYEDGWIDAAGYAACGASTARTLVPDDTAG